MRVALIPHDTKQLIHVQDNDKPIWVWGIHHVGVMYFGNSLVQLISLGDRYSSPLSQETFPMTHAQ